MNVIIDYGVGNIGSIANMLKRIGVTSVISSRPQDLRNAERIILCGVGAFDDGMNKLENLGIVDTLQKVVLEEKKPILGVCLGMQLLTEGSEEGKRSGLGFIKGRSLRFAFSGSVNGNRLKVPHMGWNHVNAEKPSRLFLNMHPDPRFYFVHSYYIKVSDPADEILTAEYGIRFTAGFEHENILGVQFHPEKSHKYGLRLYENFIKQY